MRAAARKREHEHEARWRRSLAQSASHMLLSTLAISSTPSWLSIVEERASASRALHLYRSQNLSWVDDISNSDVADAAGSSCYISSVAPEAIYSVPVLALYTVDVSHVDSSAITNDTGYANCPDVHIGSKKRTCHDGNPLLVGRTNCTYEPRTGWWYSLPASGQCKNSRSVLGRDCYWRVASLDKVVGYPCLRSHGCEKGVGGCPAAVLEKAFSACPSQLVV